MQTGSRMDWMNLTPGWLTLVSTWFVASCALWTGTLFSVSWLTGRARMMADGPEVGLAQPTRRRLEVTTGDVLVRSVTGCSKTHPYGGGAFSGGVINEYRRAA